jgi:hypothetical protein
MKRIGQWKLDRMSARELLQSMRERRAAGKLVTRDLERRYALRALYEAFAEYDDSEYGSLPEHPHSQAPTLRQLLSIEHILGVVRGDSRNTGDPKALFAETERRLQLLRERCFPIPLPEDAVGKSGQLKRGWLRSQYDAIVEQLVKEGRVSTRRAGKDKRRAEIRKLEADYSRKLREERALWTAVRSASAPELGQSILEIYRRSDQSTRNLIIAVLGVRPKKSKRGRPKGSARR